MQKTLHFAEALAGNAALLVGETEAEQIANLYRKDKGHKLRLTYPVVGGEVLDQVVPVKRIATKNFSQV